MLNLIPMPKNIIEQKGIFSFEKVSAKAFISPELEEISDMLEKIMNCSFAKNSKSPDISFIYDESEDKEGYSLIIDENGARAFACGYEGAFYALQTLRLIFESDFENKKMLSAHFVKITNDKPLYSWRGLQLDESRHFFGKDTVKKLLEFMAMYKLNVFHWHLTDDQGWRIEIKKYPRLTEIGSKRKATQLKNWRSKEMDYTPHEGFYTQEDIKEIVEYAKKLCINIVPEIDFPAHSAAAIASYNNLACREIECEVHSFFSDYIPRLNGVKDSNRTLCLGKDEVYNFVYDVIDEVSSLFPFPYFHIGGDEAPIDEWKKCPLCQKKIKEEKLKDEVALQGYFTNKVNEHLKKQGKTLIGWNEVLKAKLLDRDIVAQYWTPQRDTNVTKHLKMGGKVILSCHSAFYFDMTYSYATVKNTYTFEPTKHNVPKEYLSEVLGLEGENWTEWTDSEEQLMFKIFNRMLALSENAWSQKDVKDYGSFEKRLSRHKYYADALGIYVGEDEITMKKSVSLKRKTAQKLGISLSDYDAEYKIDKNLKKS